jgi:hypothetical protein
MEVEISPYFNAAWSYVSPVVSGYLARIGSVMANYLYRPEEADWVLEEFTGREFVHRVLGANAESIKDICINDPVFFETATKYALKRSDDLESHLRSLRKNDFISSSYELVESRSIAGLVESFYKGCVETEKEGTLPFFAYVAYNESSKKVHKDIFFNPSQELISALLQSNS